MKTSSDTSPVALSADALSGATGDLETRFYAKVTRRLVTFA